MEENSRLLKPDPPEEIVFIGPHEKGSYSKISLSNPGKENVFFKVLTTDPLAFCVKPKMGCILPGETTDVCITLRNEDSSYYTQKQPKFKILTVENSDSNLDPKLLWNGDKTDESTSLRFSCTFIEVEQNEKYDEESEFEAEQKPDKEKEESRPASYEASGSSMSLKEEQSSKRNHKSKLLQCVQVKHLIFGIMAILVSYIFASNYLSDTISV